MTTIGIYMDDYESVPFKCGYKPCQHEGVIGFSKKDLTERLQVKQCPICKVWNYRAAPILDIDKFPDIKKEIEKLKKEGHF